MQGQVPDLDFTKRTLGLDPEDLYIDTGNSSRRPTNRELAEKYGLLKCEGNCENEMEQLGIASLPVFGHTELAPCTMDAHATPAGTVTVTVTASPIVALPSTPSTMSRLATTALSAAKSVITESVQYALYDGDEN